MYVEIMKVETSGSKAGKETLLGKVVLEKGVVRYEDLPRPFIENLENEGIAGPKGVKRGLLFPSDGVEFMEALQFEFSGGYLRATEIKNGGTR